MSRCDLFIQVAKELLVGNAGGAGIGKLVVDGGAVDVANVLRFALFGTRHGIGELNAGSIHVGGETSLGGWNPGSSGELTISGGTYINTNGNFTVGLVGPGTFNMNGGILQLQENTGVVWDPLRIGGGSGDATVNLNDGTIITGGMLMDGGNNAGTATLNLLGGTFQVSTAGSWSIGMQDDSRVVFDQGTFLWKGNRIDNFSSFVDGGFVDWSNGMTNMLTESWDASWTNGLCVLYADYNDATAGYTTIWATAIPEPATPRGTTFLVK